MTSYNRYQGLHNVKEHHHLSCAKQLFNRVWELMLKEDRTDAEVDEMIHSAHASRYHWGVVGTELHFARGEWQISRAYAVAGFGQSALYHAKRCESLCLTYDLGAFDTGYAYEALARAYKLLHEEEKSLEHQNQASALVEAIESDADRQYLIDDLNELRS